ncbi:MAG: hypothetical protein ABEJ24_03210 [Candidatus Magasanikbacteria bacterium]
MRFFTLKNKETNFQEFINFWKQFYYNKNKDDYKKYINKKKLTTKELEQFSKWRNNSENLNQSKQAAWEQVEEKINLLNKFKKQKDINVKKFRDEFKFLRPRWLIYLLHWCAPSQYPIYDEYTHTTQRYIQFQIIEEMPYQDRIIEDFYFNHYVPDFYRKVNKENLSPTEIYGGLNSFGKFLLSVLDKNKMLLK